jgi:hypothetical protein
MKASESIFIVFLYPKIDLFFLKKKWSHQHFLYSDFISSAPSNVGGYV